MRYRVAIRCVALHTLFDCHFMCVMELTREIEYIENDRSENFSSFTVFLPSSMALYISLHLTCTYFDAIEIIIAPMVR